MVEYLPYLVGIGTLVILWKGIQLWLQFKDWSPVEEENRFSFKKYYVSPNHRDYILILGLGGLSAAMIEEWVYSFAGIAWAFNLFLRNWSCTQKGLYFVKITPEVLLIRESSDCFVEKSDVLSFKQEMGRVEILTRGHEKIPIFLNRIEPSQREAFQKKLLMFLE